MSGADQKLLGLSQLREGHYVFKLTVYDTKGLTGTDTVSVNVKRGKNGESKIGLLSCIKEEQRVVLKKNRVNLTMKCLLRSCTSLCLCLSHKCEPGFKV